jgi:hypothetical protein
MHRTACRFLVGSWFLLLGLQLSAPALPTAGLVAHYPLDGTALDVSGNNQNGTIQGPVTVVDRCGEAGLAYGFDGTNDMIVIPDSPLLDIGTNDLSIVLWMKTAVAGSRYLLWKGSSSSTSGYSLALTSSGSVFAEIASTALGSQIYATNHASVADGVWHHIALVAHRGGLGAIYVDGDLAGQADITPDSGSLANGFELRIGGSTPQFFAGSIDDVRIYSTALSPADVRGLFDIGCGLGLVGVPGDVTVECSSIPPRANVIASGGCGTNVPSDGLVLYYAFDADQGSLVTDLSPGGHHGAVTGATYTANGRFGGAMQFDYYDYIDVGDVFNVGGSISAMTVCAWVKIATNDRPAEMFIAGRSQGASPYTGTRLITYYQRPFCDLTSTYPTRSYCYPTNQVHDGQWHLLCGYFHAETNLMETKIYVDGVLAGTNRLVGAHASTVTLAPFRIGTRPNNPYPFKGMMDDVRVYNRELSGAEVADLYSAQGAPATAVTFSETAVGSCPQVLTRVWSATDGCGNNVSATQTITATDTQAPVLICAPDVTVACGASTDPSVTRVATAADDCDANPAVAYADQVAGVCPGTITRTWTATDACGNSSSCLQTITVETSTIILVGVPPNTTVECGHVPAPAAVTASGGCLSNAASDGLVLHYAFDSDEGAVVTDLSPSEYDGVVTGATYTANGLSGGAMQFDYYDYIEVGDVLDVGGSISAMTVCAWVKIATNDKPAEMFIAGRSQGLLPYTGTRLLSYVQRPACDLTASYPTRSIAQSTNRVHDGQWHLFCGYFHSATNLLETKIFADGVLAEANQVVGPHGSTVTPAPFRIGTRPNNEYPFKGLMDEVRVYNRELSAAEVGALYAARGGVSIAAEYRETSSGSCPRVITRIWTAADSCGASVSATQTITVIDTQAPAMTCPPDATIACGASTDPAETGTATATDCGDATPTVRYSDEVIGNCPGTITRTWTAEDNCGNSSVCVQRIAIEEPLALVGVAPDATVECGSAPAPAHVTAIGGCAGAPPSAGLVLHYPFDQNLGGIVQDASGGARTGIVHGATWVPDGVLGGAYRFDNINQNITAPDAGLPAGDTPRSFVAWVRLDAIPTEMSTEYFSYGSRANNQLASLGFDWRLNRDKFNFSQYGGVFLSSRKMDQAGRWYHVAYTYGGGGAHHFYIDGALSDGLNELSGAINTVLSGTLKLGGHPENLGAVGPDGGYLDEVMIYNRALAAAEVQALYQRQVQVAFAESSEGSCPQVITRTWTATDGCGNSVSATQTITVVDTTAPILVGVPPDLTLTCGDAVPSAPPVAATDSCGAVPGPADGLLLYYAFDADEGSVVSDLSGNGRDGAVSGARFTGEGRVGGALRFDGIDDFVQRSDAGFPTGSLPRSVSWWFQVDQAETNAITMMIEYGSNAVNRLSAWGVDWREGRNDAYYTTAGPDYGSGVRVTTGRWYHAVYAYGGGTDHNFYIDGQRSTGRSTMGVPNTALGDVFRLGWRTNQTPLKGLLDEVRVYNRKLSTNEVQSLYAGAGARQVPVQFSERQDGDCPALVTRTWAAVDECGNRADATQRIYVVDAAALYVEKTVSRDGACPGSSWLRATNGAPVSFCVSVSNRGSVALADVNLSDPALGWTGQIDALAAGQVYATSLAHVVEGDFTNVVAVTAVDPYGSMVAASASAEVDEIHPAFLLATEVMSSNGYPAIVGETIAWRVTVTNTGDVAFSSLPMGLSFDTNVLLYLGAGSPTLAAGKGADAGWASAARPSAQAPLINGVSAWLDLGALPLGASTSAVVSFHAIAPTGTGGASNLFHVVPAVAGAAGLDMIVSTGDLYAVEYGTAEGSIWVDLNANGLPDEDLSIQGLNGVSVRLSRVVGGITNLLDTTTTGTIGGRRGQYAFANLSAGIYCMETEPASVPATLGISTTPGCVTVQVASAFVPDTADFGYMAANPLAVELLGFAARPVPGGVLLEWATATEIDNLGFNLYRSVGERGALILINPALIEGAGTGQGRSYAFEDRAALDAGTYCYWLEDVEFDGDAKMHGPAVVTVGAGETGATCGFVMTSGTVFAVRASTLAAAGLPVLATDADRLQVLVDGKAVAAYVTASGRPMSENDAVLFSVEGIEAPAKVAFAIADRGGRMEECYVGPVWGDGAVWAGRASGSLGLRFDAVPEFIRYLLTGFDEEGVWMFDVTDPVAPKLLVGAETLMVDGEAGLYLSHLTPEPARCLAIDARSIVEITMGDVEERD